MFEQDTSLDERPRDWDFGIYWAQSPLNGCLPDDICKRLITAQVDNIEPAPDTFLPLFNSQTGELIHRVPTPHYLRLRRRELSRVLADGIDIRVGLPHTVTTAAVDGEPHGGSQETASSSLGI